jgi:hypothetical protein
VVSFGIREHRIIRLSQVATLGEAVEDLDNLRDRRRASDLLGLGKGFHVTVREGAAHLYALVGEVKIVPLQPEDFPLPYSREGEGRHCVEPADVLDRDEQPKLVALTDWGRCELCDGEPREPVTIWTDHKALANARQRPRPIAMTRG